MQGMGGPLSKAFWPAPDVRLRVVSGEAILLDLGSEEIFRLNESGTRIWQALSELHEPATVLEVLAGELEVERQALRDDLQELLEQLLAAGLITDEDPSAESD